MSLDKRVSKIAGTAGEAGQILEVLAKSEEPCGAKEIAEAAGLDKQVVSSRITVLKKKGLVDSPVRCKYSITDEGRASI